MANKRREAVEEFLLKYIGKITHGDTKNMDLYKNFFSKMNDNEFEEFMIKLKNKEVHLSIIVPIGGDVKVTFENNLKVAKELGYEFFQQLRYEARGDMPEFITPEKMLILKVPIKRASQLLSKKISVQEDSLHKDMLTGQVTGASKAMRITFPEIQVLSGYGLNDTIIELIKTRGGDQGESNALDNMLLRQGKANRKTIEQYQTGVRSTKTLKSFLLAMHIRSTL